MSSKILIFRKLFLILIYSFFLFTFLTNHIKSQDFSINTKVNYLTQGDQNTDGGNSIIVNGTNVFILWQDLNSTFYSYISKSTDGGTTFGNGIKIGVNNPHLFGAMAANNSGTLFTVWCGVVNDNLSGIYFSKSTDQATTFSTPVTISTDGNIPQIAVNGDNVYTCFYKPKADNKIGLFFSRSVNGGASFETPYEITSAVIGSSSVKFDSPNSIHVDAQGNIYCVWNDGRRGGSGMDIYYAKSTNSGASFGPNIMINNSTGSIDKIRTAPFISSYGENVYTVWKQEDDNNGSNRKIYFTKSTNGGTTFSAEKEISSGGFGSPTMTVSSKGEIYIAFPNYTGNQNGLFCTKSIDNGETFPKSSFINSSNADSKNPSISVDSNDMIYCTWTDDRSGNDGVYFSKGTITITDLKEFNKYIPNEFYLHQNYPNPFNPTTVIKYSIPESQNASLKVFDLLGKEVSVLLNGRVLPGNYELKFNADGLSSGIYFYRLKTENFSQTRKMIIIK